MQRSRFESPPKSLRRLKWEAFLARDNVQLVLQLGAMFAIVIGIVVAIALVVGPMEQREREQAKALCDSTPGASWAVSSGNKWMCVYPPEKALDDAGRP